MASGGTRFERTALADAVEKARKAVPMLAGLDMETAGAKARPGISPAGFAIWREPA